MWEKTPFKVQKAKFFLAIQHLFVPVAAWRFLILNFTYPKNQTVESPLG